MYVVHEKEKQHLMEIGMEYVIELEKIKKRYGKNFILNDISIKMEKGKIYGLLGTNGAGKTTMLRVIAGLIPNANYMGTVKLFGSADLGTARHKIGTTIETPLLFDNLSALRNLEMYNAIFEKKNTDLEKLLFTVGLENNKKPVKKFSLGMKQKLALAITLLGNPELIILDEPTNGLDPIAVKELRNMIVGLNQQNGTSFLISSHDVNELVKISDCLLIMKSGIVIYELDKVDLASTVADKHMEVEDYIIELMEKTYE